LVLNISTELNYLNNLEFLPESIIGLVIHNLYLSNDLSVVSMNNPLKMKLNNLPNNLEFLMAPTLTDEDILPSNIKYLNLNFYQDIFTIPKSCEVLDITTIHDPVMREGNELFGQSKLKTSLNNLIQKDVNNQDTIKGLLEKVNFYLNKYQMSFELENDLIHQYYPDDELEKALPNIKNYQVFLVKDSLICVKNN